MDIVRIDDPRSVSKAVAVLRAGGVIIYPTETAYGIGVDATNARAVAKIFAIKGRDDGKPIPIIVGSIDKARDVVEFNPQAEKLAAAFWPGPLTLVLPARIGSLAGTIHGSGTVGLRVSGLPWCRGLADALGAPITSTSANAAGSPAEYSIDGVMQSLGDAASLVDLWIDGGALSGGPVSTVALITEDQVVIKREGAISGTDIKKVLE